MFTEPETRVKVAGNRLFRHLLPGNVDAKGLKRVSTGMALCEIQQRIIGGRGLMAGAGRKGLLKLDRCAPVRTQFWFCILKSNLSVQCGIELQPVVLQ